jgi:ABC-type uncharacterized transport system involved in gliding motility auxiliary subunit
VTRRQTTIITALSIIAFFLGFMVSGRLWLRLDLTKNKAHTISKVSRNLYAEIPDYVHITYYLSGKLKTIIPSPGEIEDTLREYAAHSKGRIRVTVRDPVKGNLSMVAEEFGLQPRQVQTVEKDQASLVTVYSGIVIEYLDKTEVLPWVISTDTLEYDITSRIRSMVMDTERRLGVIVGDSYRQWREDFSFLNQTLAEAGYMVRLVPPGDEIPESLPAVFVLGGAEDFDEWALYRIDRYIQLGGKVLFAVKGVYVDTASGSIEARPFVMHNAQGLLDMIASYGITIKQELVLDRNALTLQYQTRLPSGAVQFRIVRYPLWIGVLADNGNPDHPVSAAFTGLDLYWPSPLELHPPSQVEAVPLFKSTKDAWLMKESFNTNPEIGYLLEKDAAETRGEKILGASLNGLIPGFFSGKPKPVRAGSDSVPEFDELPDMPRQASPSRIIVVGDTDFATNIINATGARHNLDFFQRAADWLSSDDDIIGIRNRQPYVGRLDKIAEPQRRAAAMRFAQVLNVAVIPILVIAVGIVLSSRRRSRSRNAEIISAKENSGAI